MTWGVWAALGDKAPWALADLLDLKAREALWAQKAPLDSKEARVALDKEVPRGGQAPKGTLDLQGLRGPLVHLAHLAHRGNQASQANSGPLVL